MRNVTLFSSLARPRARFDAFKYVLCGASFAACAQSPALEGVAELDGSTQQVVPGSDIDAGMALGAERDDAGERVRPPATHEGVADAGDAGPTNPDAGLGGSLLDAGELDPDSGMDAQVVVPDTGPSVPTCTAGTTLCGSACVDLTTDPLHCGACGTSCGAAACAASVCGKPVPAGCTPQAYGGHAYLFCTTQLNWIDARNACRKEMLDMTVIDSAEENAFVRGAGETWIGVSDIDGEGKWRALAPGVTSRADGPLASYLNWAPGEPSNTLYCAQIPAVGNDCLGLVPDSEKKDEDCGLMQADGRWDDMRCSLERQYVCESY
jgi:hypothetical protein